MDRHSTSPLTRRRLRLAMLGGGIVALAAVTVAIAAFAKGGAPTRPDFKLSVTPQTQTAYLHHETSYAVSISRLNGLNGPVTLSVAQLPARTSATWTGAGGAKSGVLRRGQTSARLALLTTWRTPTGARTLTVKATARRADGTKITHSTDVALTVRRLFAITGSLSRPLYPGASAPLDLTLINGNEFGVKVTGIGVHIASTSRGGCATGNFTATQLPSSVYPLTLPAGASRTLSGLGVTKAQLPRVAMVDSPVNQDACKATKVTLFYWGAGRR